MTKTKKCQALTQEERNALIEITYLCEKREECKEQNDEHGYLAACLQIALTKERLKEVAQNGR